MNIFLLFLEICSLAGSISRGSHICTSSVCDNMGELYRNCDLDTVVNFLAKQVLLISPEESRTHLELFRMCRSWRRRTRRQWGRSWCSSAPPYSPATGGTKLWWSSKLMEISGKTARAPAALANWSCRSAWSCCPSTPTASWRATHSRAAGGPGCTFYKRWNDLITF